MNEYLKCLYNAASILRFQSEFEWNSEAAKIEILQIANDLTDYANKLLKESKSCNHL